ncbi:glutathione-regulated potassium-efflux system ancillary protein KefG [Vibrio sp. SCSIO 43136]|uniref:glutathione-regulated potassium-efflux system ancillary protein KefG n=1 Tax=Vibrio sp. SCSIO 43136 TaxID=2819101 RepID=UPI0020759F5C|nr:glutathione-regulated potassium-efflux system ancillary protein KefG [Vibrio sp. SCSIO 43136]USD65520.1 glutathione-regulated potassium-efflux system ancillary protein KefG [Vibrio sp. SCSIO 43136]
MQDVRILSANSPKVLVIFVHPDPDKSIANKALIRAIEGLPHVTVHDLYAHYPDFFIDVPAEQKLLVEHDIIVFQHPLYMYSCPALLKEWMDRVIEKDFAFGEGLALAGKKWRCIITTGGAESAFASSGYNKYPLSEILQPFELTASLCRMEWLEPMVLYWARNVSDGYRNEHAMRYRNWIISLATQEEDDGSNQ